MTTRFAIRGALLSSAVATMVACGSSGGDDSNGNNGSGGNNAVDASTAGGDSSAGNAVGPTSDGGAAGDVGGGSPSDGASGDGASGTYPAFPVDTAVVVAGKQATLSAPVVVTISWSGDPLASTWEAYGDEIGTTSYWADAVSEYGVGALASGPANHVRLTEAVPAQITEDQVAALVQNNAGAKKSDAGPPWPAPTDQTIYAVYLPDGTKLVDSSGNDDCAQGIGGYHDDVFIGGKPVAYAVMLHCNEPTIKPPVVFTDVDVEESAAHELAEAATDPFPTPQSGTPVMGYAGFDEPHYAWELWNAYQDEVGDACESFAESYYQESPPFPYWVQRIWSNKSATEGHDPCTPRLGVPYYNVTLFPAQMEDVTLDLTLAADTKRTMKGFKAAVGKSVTFQVGYFSDADTGGPWTLTSRVDSTLPFPDNNGNDISNGTATVTIDKPSGRNGDQATITVTPMKAGQLGFQLVVLTSSLFGSADASTHPSHYVPIVIANQ
jgi:hypothetical protein